jgi:hypothetical protein
MMVSDDYIEAVASGLKDAMDRGTIRVLTLCLTPDWTCRGSVPVRCSC